MLFKLVILLPQDSLLRLQVRSAWYDGGPLHWTQTGQTQSVFLLNLNIKNIDIKHKKLI